MPNEFDRLRQANPATETSYRHGSLDVVARRAALPEVSKSVRFAQGFRMKMASAALGAALLTTGAITALETGAPSLPVLALGGTSHSSTAKSDSMVMMPSMQNYSFVAGEGLSSATSAAPAFRMVPVADPEGFVIGFAEQVGIYDAAVSVEHQSNDSMSSMTANTETYSYTNNGYTIYLWTSANSLSYWDYSTAATDGSVVSPDSTSSTASGVTIARSDLTRWGSEFFAGLNTGLQIGNFDATDYQCTGCAGGDWGGVTATVTAGGYTTDVTMGANFLANGDLVNAYGSAGSLEQVGPYPLISERDGVSKVSEQSDATYLRVRSTDGVAPTSSPSGVSGVNPGSPSLPSGGDDAVTTTTAAPKVYEVTLDRATVKLATYTLSDNTSWLVPVFEYHGTWTNDTGDQVDGTWTTVAVSSDYITVSSGNPYGGGPIAY